MMEDFIIEDWPDKQPGGLAVVYVALTGESFSEAVTLTLAQYGEDILIRQLEWESRDPFVLRHDNHIRGTGGRDDRCPCASPVCLKRWADDGQE